MFEEYRSCIQDLVDHALAIAEGNEDPTLIQNIEQIGIRLKQMNEGMVNDVRPAKTVQIIIQMER